MRNIQFSITLATVLVAGLLLVTSGCELRTSGATATTTVTLKLGEDEATENGDGGATGGTQAAAGGFGTLSGSVVFEGNAPQLSPIYKAGAAVRDANVCAATDLPNERLIVDGNGGVQNVFVYLPKTPKGVGKLAVPEEPAIFDQKGCRFIPHAMIVRTDQEIRILSNDAIAHNTHTFPNRASGFNRGIPVSDRVGVAMTYDKYENQPIEVKCDFHAWMIAYHLPLDHPYAAVTKADGSFEIPQLPAGTHKFRVWHEGATGGFLSRNLSVTIKPNETTTIKIPYAAGRFAAAGQLDTKRVRLSSLSKGVESN